MKNIDARWITHPQLKDWEPVDPFCRQLEQKRFEIPADEQNLHILFRRSFEVDTFGTALLNISADDYFKLYINGKFVTQGPAAGYPSRYFYNTVDVTKFLNPGKNTIAVHTYYQGLINRVWVSGDRRSGVWMELFADDRKILVSDESFRCAFHSAYSSCGKSGYETQFLEHYDARMPEVGFQQPEYDDSAWTMASFRKYVDYQLIKQPTRQLVFEKIKPLDIKKSGNTLKIDFGAINIGYLKFSAKGSAGSKIEIRCAQELNEDGSLRWELRANSRYREFFTLSGELDSLDQYDYKAFRYAELIMDEGVEVAMDSIAFDVRHYPFELKAHCKYNDEKALAVWQLCCDTLKYGTQEMVLDCMEREKGYYMGDGCYTQWTQCLLTDDFTMMEKFFDDFLATSFINRGLMTCANCSFMQEIAEYPFIFIMHAWIYLAHTGRKDFIKERYAKFADVLDYFHETYADSDGLLKNLDKWCVVEWPKEFRDGYDVDITERQICKVKHNAINAYYIGAVKSLNKIAAYLDLPPYKDVTVLEENFRKAFYSAEKKLFKDSVESDHISTMGNIYAAFFGLCPDEESKKAVTALIREKRFSGCNFFALIPMMVYLMVQQEDDLFQSLLRDENAWLRTIREDGKRTFEGWGKESKWNTSLFHLTMSEGALCMIDWDMENILDFSRN